MGTEDVSPFSGWIQASYDNTPDSAGTGASGITGLKLNPQGGTVSTGAGLNVAGNIQAGGLTILDQQPKIYLTDNAGGTNDPDYLIQVDGGSFLIYDVTNTSNKILINPDGHIDILPNTDFGAGIDVTGNSTFSNTATFSGHVRSTGTDGISIDTAGYAYLNFQTDRTNASDNIGGPIFKNASGTVVSRIQSFVDGQINIRTGSGNSPDYAFVAKPDGAVELYHNGTKKAETNTQGILTPNDLGICFGDAGCKVSGKAGAGASQGIFFMTNSSGKWQITGDGHVLPSAVGSYDIGSTSAEIGNVYIADDKRFYAGSDQNLSLHHNNTTGINYLISNPGNMFYMSATNYFTDAAQSKIQAQFIHNSYCELRHAGNLKFRTSETGIDVTGEVAATQDYPNFRPTLDFNFEAEKKLDSRIVYYRTGPASYHDESGKVVIVGDNQPRFDHTFPEYWYHGNLGDSNSRGISKGLLIEPTRTNLYKNNHSLKTANDHANMSYVLNTTETTAPDGTFTATKVTGAGWTRWDGNNGLDLVGVNFTDTFSTSIYMKTVGTSNINVGMDFGDSGNATFSVGQEWKRYSISNVHQNYGGSTKFIDIVFDSAGGVYIWGLQCENGSHPTSYIPTSGTTVTRGNEYAVIDGEDFTDFYNPVESSVLAVGTMHRPAAAQGQLNIFHIGDNNEDGHGVFREHGTKDVWYHIRNGNSTPSGGNLNPNGFGDWDAGEEARIAIAFKDGDQAISVNGGNQITASVTSSYPTANITKMWIGSHGNGSYFEGHIKRISYYPKQLTDNQLNTLTA